MSTERGRARRREGALAIHPLIDAVQDQLDTFQVIYEEGGDVRAAFAGLEMAVSTLEDALDKNDEANR